MKQDAPILVILGNPPYNGFAGMAVDEERDLSTAYRTTRRVRRPEGQGLNDLYVRFFRMAERRIAEKTGQGVVCFISNYSWLDSLSCPGMRERYLEAFDVDPHRQSQRRQVPDGESGARRLAGPQHILDGRRYRSASRWEPLSPCWFARRSTRRPRQTCSSEDLWGQAKLEALTETAEAEPDALYEHDRDGPAAWVCR